MDQRLMPAVIVTPGEILKKELDERGLTQKDLALAMRRPEQAVSEIINGKKRITPDTALELENALAISAEFWLNLETNYRLHLARRREQDTAIGERAALLRELPLTRMERRGWLRLPRDPQKFVDAVVQFMGFNPLCEQPKLSVRYRNSTVGSPNTLSTEAWLRRVQQLASQGGSAVFDKERLRGGIPEVLRRAEKAEDVARMRDVLDTLGVCFVIVPHLPKTYLDGATCFFDGRAVAALTLRYDRMDAFWFTLMHEVAHLLEESRECYVDELSSLGARKRSDAGGTRVATEEIEANSRTQDWLVPPQPYAAFVRATTPHFGRAQIRDFAQEIGRHPGIVLGRLMRDGHVSYRHLRETLEKVSPHLEGQIDVARDGGR